MKLYEIETDLAELEAALIEGGGEISPEDEVRFEDLLDARKDKIEGYARVMQRLKAQQEMFKAERERLQTKERACASSYDFLRRRLAYGMADRQETHHDTPIGTLRLMAGRESVVIYDEPSTLPSEYVKVTYVADKTAIRKALKSGEDHELDKYAELVPGAPYVQLF